MNDPAKYFLALAAWVVVWGGCAPAMPEPSEITLTAVSREEFDARVADHRGQVVLVDFWGTWCAPCIEQFPHSVELERRFRERGLTVLSVSVDDEADREAVLAFLRAQGAGGIENLISMYGVGSRSMEAFDVPGGALPHYKLYDRMGKLRHTFTLDPTAERQFAPADIDAAVENLLGE